MIWLIILALCVGYLSAVLVQMGFLSTGSYAGGGLRLLVFVCAAIITLYVTGVLPV